MAEQKRDYDLAVVGSGPGGYWAAIRAAEYGLSVAVVEKDNQLGGACLHVGCIPTKALLHTAEVLDSFRHALDFGIQAEGFTLDWAKLQARKDQIVGKHAKGIEFLFRKNKVEWIRGAAQWAGPGKLRIQPSEGEAWELRARDIIVATGSSARMLPGLTPSGKILSNIEILSLPAPPKALIIIGAGAVGIEFASMYKRFGTEVTVLEMLPRVLPIEDEEISKEMEKHLKKQKITVHTGAKVSQVETTGAGVSVGFTTADGKPQRLEADHVLVAVGRAPNTAGLGLEKSRVQLERGFIKTDGFMRTAEPHVYAIGDVVFGSPQLAHVASAEGLVAAAHIAGKPATPLNYLHSPNCTYCEPQVASVGLTEQALRQQGVAYKAGKFTFQGNSKATILGQHEGFIKILADARTGTVLGVHMIGPLVTELISEAVLGMQLEVAADELMGTIHAHPTLYEAMLDAANAVYGLTINS